MLWVVLPRLGGAPAVWTACVVFFQAALLAGYAYAHWAGRRAPRSQLAIHAGLLLLPFGGLPFRLPPAPHLLLRAHRPGGRDRGRVQWPVLLSYLASNRRVRFEIDPLVKRIAEDERYFRHLPEVRKRGVEAEVVLGDARLTLGSAAGAFDVLVLDAFTSGAIPVHLLPREAFVVYEGKLRAGGLLAFHISDLWSLFRW